ncbi:MAG TPA: D-2-hydroxyacid dehydrogenase [Caulobacteraceae bacterium]|nr:D-2-hydroxyacid dehydrogenase [Caulobacteraceae bacterium]
MTRMTRILVNEPAFRRIEPDLSAVAAKAEIVRLQPDGALRLGDCEITAEEAAPNAGWMSAEMFGVPAFRRWRAVLLASAKLDWVQSAAAGFDDPVFKELVAKGARLTTNTAQSVAMAEYVLWGVLDHFQRGTERRKAQSQHEWARLRYREVFGSRWLIIGFGAIGQAVAVRAASFSAHVTGVRRSGGSHPAAAAIVAPEALDAALPEADVVVLAVPLSPATESLVDAGFLAAMKPGSVLVNVGRGGLVDEAALIAALDNGVPEHALLDVFQVEPLPPESVFWGHPRVTMTGHASALGEGFVRRSDALFRANLDRYLSGEPLLQEARREDVMAG